MNITHLGSIAGRFAWPTVALATVGLLTAGRMRAERGISEISAQRDSLATQLGKEQSFLSTELTIGDSLPPISVVTSTGASVPLRGLARRGVRFFYLYRRNCAACQLLAPFWIPARKPTAPSIANITFDPEKDLPADTVGSGFTWHHDSTTRGRPLIRFVPALLEANSSSVIVGVAYGLPQVEKMGGMFHLIDQARLDSLLRAYQASHSAIDSASLPQ